MVACWLAWAVLFGVGAQAPVGVAFHYERPGAMARVATIRQMPIAWGQVNGLASLPDCRYVQPVRPWFVRARFWRGQGWGPWEVYQIVDCSDPRHLPRQRARGLAPWGMETDLASARRNGFAWERGQGKGRTRVQVGWRWQP